MKTVSVRVSEESAERIEKFAKAMKMEPSAAADKLVASGFGRLKALKDYNDKQKSAKPAKEKKVKAAKPEKVKKAKAEKPVKEKKVAKPKAEAKSAGPKRGQVAPKKEKKAGGEAIKAAAAKFKQKKAKAPAAPAEVAEERLPNGHDEGAAKPMAEVVE